MIALSEILYAGAYNSGSRECKWKLIELTKSSPMNKEKLVNGTLSTFLKQKDQILANKKAVSFQVFKQ